jgi:deoxyribodipyrimidine photolyase-related protein
MATIPKRICIIFPHQLFRNHPCLEKEVHVLLVEELLFFRQYRFHWQKLVLHRASMKFYEDWLIARGLTVNYINAQETGSDCRELIAQLAANGVTEIRIAEPADDWLRRRMTSACRKNEIHLAAAVERNTPRRGRRPHGRAMEL